MEHDDLHSFAGELTGRDTRDIKNRDHIRGVYKYTESQQISSNLIGKTFIVKAAEVIFIAVIVFLGLKVGK
jgi:hypothetical protein